MGVYFKNYNTGKVPWMTTVWRVIYNIWKKYSEKYISASPCHCRLSAEQYDILVKEWITLVCIERKKDAGAVFDHERFIGSRIQSKIFAVHIKEAGSFLWEWVGRKMDREQRRILPGSLAERTERGHQPIRCLCGGKSGKSCLIRIRNYAKIILP